MGFLGRFHISSSKFARLPVKTPKKIRLRRHWERHTLIIIRSRQTPTGQAGSSTTRKNTLNGGFGGRQPPNSTSSREATAGTI